MTELGNVSNNLHTHVGQSIYNAVAIPDFEGDVAKAMRQQLAAALVKVDVLSECVLQLDHASEEAHSVIKYYVKGSGNIKKVPDLDELGYWSSSGEERDVVRDIKIDQGSVVTVVVEDTKKKQTRTSGLEGVAGAQVPPDIFNPIFDNHTKYAQSAQQALTEVSAAINSLPTRETVRNGEGSAVTLSRSVFSSGKFDVPDTSFVNDPVARDMVKATSYATPGTSLTQALNDQRSHYLDTVTKKESTAQETKTDTKAATTATPAATAAAPRISFPTSGGGSAPRVGGLGTSSSSAPTIPGLTKVSSLPTEMKVDDLIDIDALFDKFSQENAQSSAPKTVEEDTSFDYSTVPDGYLFTGYDDDGTVIFKEIPQDATPIYSDKGYAIGYWPPGADPDTSYAESDSSDVVSREYVDSEETVSKVTEEDKTQAREKVEEILTQD